MALQDPAPGAAWAQVCQLAARSGKLAELRKRWENRADDPAALLLLGWLEWETGDEAKGREWFGKVAERSPDFYPAQMAVARTMVSAAVSDAEMEREARGVAALARSDEERYSALHLIADHLRAQGKMTETRQFLINECDHAATPGLRLLLAPEAARARLAEETLEEWLAGLEKSHRDGGAWIDSAIFAKAAATLGDPALALRIASKALERHPGEFALREIAAQGAVAAGFATEAGRYARAALPENPGPAALVSAVERMVSTGATNALRELLGEHGRALATVSAQWRSHLPRIEALGAIDAVRAELAKHTGAAGWEAQLTLAEASVLARDYAAAARQFWDFLKSPAQGSPLSSLTRDTANQGFFGTFVATPLPREQLANRLGEAMQLYAEAPVIFSRNSETGGWIVPSRVDAQDYAIACLHRLALMEDTENAFIEALAETVSAWPAEEQLLAGAIVGSPRIMVEALERIARDPGAYSERSIAFARGQLARVRALHWLSTELAIRAERLALPGPEPNAPRAQRLRPRWERALYPAFKAFVEGKEAEADAAFQKALPLIAEYRLYNVEAFYTSLFIAQKSFPPDRADKALNQALRWMAQETARRLDLPSPPNYSAVFEETPIPSRWMPLFTTGESPRMGVQSGGRYVPFPGGWVPRPQSYSLWYLAASDRGRRFAFEEPAGLDDTTGRVLRAYHTLLATWTADYESAKRDIDRLSAAPGGEAAALLGAIAGAEVASAAVPGRALLRPHPSGPVGRAAYLHAKCFLHNSLLDPEIATLPMRAAEELVILTTIQKTAGDTAAARFAQQRGPTEPATLEAADAALALRKLALLAEVDAASALARRVLAAPPSLHAALYRAQWRGDGSEAVQTFARREAMAALEQMGELPDYFKDIQRQAAEPSASSELQRRVLELANFLTARDSTRRLERKASALERQMEKLATDARGESLRRLALAEPDAAVFWQQREDLDPNKDPADRQRMLEEIVTSPAAERMSAGQFDQILARISPAGLAALLPRLTLHKRRGETDTTASVRQRAAVALRLWGGGFKAEAIAWWRKAIAASDEAPPADVHDTLFVAAAMHGDRELLAQCIAEVITATARVGSAGRAFPVGTAWYPAPTPPPTRPLFEAAQRHGVLDRVEALLADSGGFGPDLALFAKCLRGDREATGELERRFAAAAKPMPLGLAEEFATLLAERPDQRTLCASILDHLAPLREQPTGDLRFPAVARHARIAIACGHKDAAAWLQRATLSLERGDASNRLEMLKDVLEAATADEHREVFQAAAGLYVHMLASNFYGLDGPYRWLASAAERDKRKLTQVIATAIQGSAEFKRNQAFESIRLQEHARLQTPAEGDPRLHLPTAWVASSEDDPNDGLTTIAWDLAWYHQPEGSPPVLTTAAREWPKLVGKCTVELLWGRDSSRLETLKRMEGVNPRGTTRVKLPAPAGAIAVSLRIGDQTILGMPRNLIGFAKPVPLGEELISPLWTAKATALAPVGRAFAPASVLHSNNQSVFEPTLLGVYPISEANNLQVSAWLRGGKLRVTARDGVGKVLHEREFAARSPVGWGFAESYFSMTEAKGVQRLPAETKDIAVWAMLEGEISGVWVAAFKNTSPSKETPAPAPPATEIPGL